MAMNEELGKGSGPLERLFFGGDKAPLLLELRQRSVGEEPRKLLREFVKIQDEAFLNRLVALNFRPATALAVTLVPLICVAWGDGKVEDRERDAILEAARQRGVAAGRIAEQLLRQGLAQAPDPRLFQLWEKSVRKLWGCFSTDERWKMRTNLLQSARGVAEAAGGLLGLTSKISAGERRVLEQIEAILD